MRQQLCNITTQHIAITRRLTGYGDCATLAGSSQFNEQYTE